MKGKLNMKGKLMISELTINIDEETGRKYLYGSLIDFYADTEEGLEKLTDIMYENDLFDFYNNGPYEGLDSKTEMYWTFDDGKPSMDWFLKVAAIVKSMNDNKNKLVITIDKSFLLYHKAVEDLTLGSGRKAKKKEEMIDIYTYYLKKVLEENGYKSLLETRIKGKLYESIPSELESGKIYIDI